MEGAGTSSMEGFLSSPCPSKPGAFTVIIPPPSPVWLSGTEKASERSQVVPDSPPNQHSKDSAWPTRPFYTAPFGGGWVSTMLFATLCVAASRSYDGLTVGELLYFDAVVAIDHLCADFVSAND